MVTVQTSDCVVADWRAVHVAPFPSCARFTCQRLLTEAPVQPSPQLPQGAGAAGVVTTGLHDAFSGHAPPEGLTSPNNRSLNWRG